MSDVLTYDLLARFAQEGADMIDSRPAGDAAISQFVSHIIAHPKDVRRAELMLDAIFGPRWRNL